MASPLCRFLILGLLLLALPAWGDDMLPRLPTGGPESLPTLNSSSLNMAAVPDRALYVTCYLGNPNNNQSLGGGLMVNAPEAAGPTCNSLNYACQGRCFGCYADFDLSEDICVDAAGRKFIR